MAEGTEFPCARANERAGGQPRHRTAGHAACRQRARGIHRPGSGLRARDGRGRAPDVRTRCCRRGGRVRLDVPADRGGSLVGCAGVDAARAGSSSRRARWRPASWHVDLVAHALVEAERAEEDFARLWRADGDPEIALTQVLEASPASWIHDWAVARYGREPRGPTIEAVTAALSLITVLLLVSVAVAVARRRRIV